MYIGIDLGTTGCKTVMFSQSGDVLCEFNKEYGLIFEDTFVEQDANLWWELVLEGIKYVVSETGINKISGISVSTQGISFVPVDKEGNTLDNAISWLDVRAEDESKYLCDNFGGEKLYGITGIFCLPDYSLPKLMWYKSHKKDVYEAANKILFPLDFLNLKLCGKAICDYTIAGGTMLYDIHNKCWSRELLDFTGIDEAKLPAVGCMGQAVGKLFDSVASEVGIVGECTVFLGGQDQKLAAIGAGISENVCSVSFGTATAISKLTVTDGKTTVFRFNDDRYISETALMTTGAALRWLSHTLYGSMSYKEMDELCAQSCPGANGVTFKCDLSVGGEISGITLSTTAADIIYALYEGVSHDIADAVERLGGAEKLKVFGGGSKSDIWCQILSRIAKIPVEILSTSETASLGAAILASQFNIPPAKTKKTFYPEG